MSIRTHASSVLRATSPSTRSSAGRTSRLSTSPSPSVPAAVAFSSGCAASRRGQRRCSTRRWIATSLAASIGSTDWSHSSPAYWVALVLGLTALTLTMAGVCGVVAYLVRQRTQEIGVRIALGATTWNVLRLVVAQSLRQALLGAAIGSVLALGVARLLAANIESMPTFDVIAFVGALACVLLACMIAALVPSWHAVRIDPASPLRHD